MQLECFSNASWKKNHKKKQSAFHASLSSSAKHNNRYLRIWHYSTLCGMLLTSRWQCEQWSVLCTSTVVLKMLTTRLDQTRFVFRYLQSKHESIGERLIFRLASLRVKTTSQMKSPIILLLRWLGLIFPGRGEMIPFRIYMRTIIWRRTTKSIISLFSSILKNILGYIGWFLAKYWSYEDGTLTTQ